MRDQAPVQRVRLQHRGRTADVRVGSGRRKKGWDGPGAPGRNLGVGRQVGGPGGWAGWVGWLGWQADEGSGRV